MATLSTPSSRFIQSLSANLAYWLGQTEHFDDEVIVRLAPDLPNVIQAITIGLACPETQQSAGQLLTQCFMWAESVGALLRWQELLEKSLNAQADMLPMDRITHLKQLSQCFRRHRKLDKAIHCLEVAAELAQDILDPLVKAELHINMSQALRHKHLYPAAEEQARLALALLPSSQRRLMAIAWQTLGFIAQAEGNHTQAEGHFREALASTYPQQKLSEHSRTVNGLTHSLHALGRTTEALALYQELTVLLEPTPYTLDKLEVGINWGALLYSLGHLDRAEAIFRQTEGVANGAEGMLIPKAHLANNLGCVLRDKKAWHSAEIYLKRALALWQKIEEPFFVIKTQLNLTKLYLQSGSFAAAHDSLEQVQTLSQQHSEKPWAAALLADGAKVERQLEAAAGKEQYVSPAAAATS